MPRFRITHIIDTVDEKAAEGAAFRFGMIAGAHVTLEHTKITKIKGPFGKRKKWGIYLGKTLYCGPNSKSKILTFLKKIKVSYPKENWVILEI